MFVVDDLLKWDGLAYRGEPGAQSYSKGRTLSRGTRTPRPSTGTSLTSLPLWSLRSDGSNGSNGSDRSTGSKGYLWSLSLITVLLPWAEIEGRNVFTLVVPRSSGTVQERSLWNFSDSRVVTDASEGRFTERISLSERKHRCFPTTVCHPGGSSGTEWRLYRRTEVPLCHWGQMALPHPPATHQCCQEFYRGPSGF